jgi:subtilisin family serine protease
MLPSATQNNAPWWLDRIDQRTPSLDTKYIYNRTGAGVYIYVVDGGVDPNESELSGRVLDGFNVNGQSSLGDCNPVSRHGTLVSMIAAGTTSGVAKQATIISVRITNATPNCGWQIGDVTAGLNWIAQDVGHRPAVVNISGGFDVTSAIATSILPLEQAVASLSDAGIPVVVAAGNNGNDGCAPYPAYSNNSPIPHSPGRVPAAITVAASVQSNDAPESSSNIGSCVDIFAPGGNVLGSSGTSLAAPHVAGAIALHIQTYGQNSGLTLINRGEPDVPISPPTTTKLLYMGFIPPPPPSAPYADNITSTAATVHWTNGDPSFSTLVEYKLHSAGTWSSAGTVAAGQTSKPLSGLSSNAAYDLRLTHTKTDVDNLPMVFQNVFTTLPPPPPPVLAVITTNYQGGTQPMKNQFCWYYGGGSSGGSGALTFSWSKRPPGGSWTVIASTTDVNIFVKLPFELRLIATDGIQTDTAAITVTPPPTGGATCVL